MCPDQSSAAVGDSGCGSDRADLASRGFPAALHLLMWTPEYFTDVLTSRHSLIHHDCFFRESLHFVLSHFSHRQQMGAIIHMHLASELQSPNARVHSEVWRIPNSAAHILHVSNSIRTAPSTISLHTLSQRSAVGSCRSKRGCGCSLETSCASLCSSRWPSGRLAAHAGESVCQ